MGGFWGGVVMRLVQPKEKKPKRPWARIRFFRVKRPAKRSQTKCRPHRSPDELRLPPKWIPGWFGGSSKGPSDMESVRDEFAVLGARPRSQRGRARFGPLVFWPPNYGIVRNYRKIFCDDIGGSMRNFVQWFYCKNSQVGRTSICGICAVTG